MEEMNYASSLPPSIPAFIPALKGGAFCEMCGNDRGNDKRKSKRAV